MIQHPIIKFLKTVPSTNDYLTEWLQREPLPEGTVVVTENQNKGRGQRGNSWESECGKNLTFSLLLYPGFIAINQHFILSQIVALAIKESLDILTPDISIKWPNDIYFQEQKIGGILIENSIQGRHLESTVIGVGLNINQSHFSADLPHPVSLVQILHRELELSRLLELICNRLFLYYHKIQEATFQKEVSQLYFSSLFRKEGYHLYFDRLRNEKIEAKIEAVLPQGTFVLLLKNGEQRSFQFKEVEFLFI